MTLYAKYEKKEEEQKALTLEDIKGKYAEIKDGIQLYCYVNTSDYRYKCGYSVSGLLLHFNNLKKNNTLILNDLLDGKKKIELVYNNEEYYDKLKTKYYNNNEKTLQSYTYFVDQTYKKGKFEDWKKNGVEFFE